MLKNSWPAPFKYVGAKAATPTYGQLSSSQFARLRVERDCRDIADRHLPLETKRAQHLRRARRTPRQASAVEEELCCICRCYLCCVCCIVLSSCLTIVFSVLSECWPLLSRKMPSKAPSQRARSLLSRCVAFCTAWRRCCALQFVMHDIQVMSI